MSTRYVIAALLVLTVGALPVSGKSTWTLLDNDANPDETGSLLFAVVRISATTLCGGAQTPDFGSNSGQIWCTDDDGATWLNRPMAEGETIARVRWMQFPDEQSGWAVGGGSSGGLFGFVGRTLDGGETWEDLSPAMMASLQSSVSIPLFYLSAFDTRAALVANYGEAWITRDGGSTWTEIGLPEQPYPLALVRATTEEAVFAFNGTHVFVSYDLGDTWTPHALPWPVHGRALSVFEYRVLGDHLYCVVERAEGGTTLWLSTNAGADWTPLYTREDVALRSSFVQAGRTWVGGRGFLASMGDDQTWIVEYQNATDPFDARFRASAGTDGAALVWAAGAYGDYRGYYVPATVDDPDDDGAPPGDGGDDDDEPPTGDDDGGDDQPPPGDDGGGNGDGDDASGTPFAGVLLVLAAAAAAALVGRRRDRE